MRLSNDLEWGVGSGIKESGLGSGVCVCNYVCVFQKGCDRLETAL
jgi:hypothetical protein